MDGRKYLGAIAIGRWVDFLVMEGIAAPLDSHASLLLDNTQVVASDLPKALRADLVTPPEQEERLGLTGGASTQLRLGSDNYFTGYAQISNGGIDVATLVITSEATVIAGTRNAVNRLLFAAAMIVAAVALGLAWLSGRRITRPIQELTATAQLVREGDLSAQAPVAGEDEVGQLGETFNEMTASLLRMTENLRLAAREESALRARIETIIQSMADGLVAVDADMNVLAYNREAEHLTGVPAEEAIGRPVSEILVARDGQGTEVPLPIHSLAEGSIGSVFLDSRGRSGIPVAITSAVLKGDDDVISGAVAVIRDTTREREIERMKTEFLSNISHELRTPLTPIKGYAEILGRKPVSREKQLQFVGGILESTSRLERIVELLVDFAAMEAGRMAPRSSQVDMATLLNDLSDRWKKRAPNHRLQTELPPALPVIVGDERLLRRSLEEVLDNAIKFSPRGGTITLSAKTVPSNGVSEPLRLEVTITDEGIGINPDDLPQIFSDFRQLDGSETRTYGGLGLGLAFVRRIAQAHDGDVRVESVPDEGTSFTIQLPCLEFPEGVPGD
jgi:PAS domain S-box-containing protein